MPRYYFNVVVDGRLTRDLEGVYLPNLEAARQHAVADARDLVAIYIRERRSWTGARIEVVDRTAQVLHVMPLSSAIDSGSESS